MAKGGVKVNVLVKNGFTEMAVAAEAMVKGLEALSDATTKFGVAVGEVMKKKKLFPALPVPIVVTPTGQPFTAYNGQGQYGFVKPVTTATTWVAKDKNGQMVAINVVDMDDQHLFRWIHYFRKKFLDSGFNGNVEELDSRIKAAMVTAPAIYAEAAKRGIVVTATAAVTPAPRTATVEVRPGRRLITLEDDDDGKT